jgi:hypothetical protein
MRKAGRVLDVHSFAEEPYWSGGSYERWIGEQDERGRQTRQRVGKDENVGGYEGHSQCPLGSAARYILRRGGWLAGLIGNGVLTGLLEWYFVSWFIRQVEGNMITHLLVSLILLRREQPLFLVDLVLSCGCYVRYLSKLLNNSGAAWPVTS